MDIPLIYAQIEQNFILEERRDFEDFKRTFTRDGYEIYYIIENGEKVGFAGVWRFSDFTFIEHLVVFEGHRNSGAGGRALELMKETFGALCLECEPPISPIATRRLNFYARHGMCINPQSYRQPPYRKGGNGVDLKLLSYPDYLSDFDLAVKLIYAKVYGVL